MSLDRSRRPEEGAAGGPGPGERWGAADEVRPSGAPLTDLDPDSAPALSLGGATHYPGPPGARPLDDDAYALLVANRAEAIAPILDAAGPGAQAGPGGPGAPAGPGFRPALGPGLIVALDVDGTILDRDGRVSDRLHAALSRLTATGAQIVVSTGRSVFASLPVAHHIGVRHGWMVCANGALTLRLDPGLERGHEVIDSVTFDPAHVISILRQAIPEGIFAVEVPDEGFLVTRLFPDGELIEDQRVVSHEEIISRPVNRVVLRAPAMGLEEFSALVRSTGSSTVEEYSIGWTSWLDVAPEGVSKATALAGLAARLGTDASQVVAVGDGTNDIEMLRWAGLGVAMGSAPESVKASADIITESVWHDGCAAVLDALVDLLSTRSLRAAEREEL
ncbi:HAD family hydrolase [Actinomyces marmotae]|uniref:HAD family hydrolase n=1 Tax=Actinomyces marmotae TaxID=2737173 RepID=UPI00135A24FD|nr:HAD family hydrolase [Actinomyces marmotae]